MDHEPSPDNPKIRPIGARPLADADYRLMVETAMDHAIFMIDVNGVIRSWNKGVEVLKGYGPDELLGRHFSIFYPQELKDRSWPQHELSEAARTGRFEDEGWRVRKDGSRFWANIVITRLLGEDGQIRGYSKITRDLTERRKHEELLRTSEERFRLLVENVKDYAIYMLDPAGHVISWNAGAEKNKGYVASEILGRHFSTFYPPELAGTDAPLKELRTALENGRFEDEGWRVRKDGSRFWAGVVLTAIFDANGTHRGFAKVTRDLTQSRKMTSLEDEGRRMSTFLAMLGHELRSPLAPMTNAVGLLRHPNIGAEMAAKARDIIDRQLQHMKRLVDDLLDVGRITGGKIQLETKPVRLQDVVALAIEACMPGARLKEHALTAVLPATDIWVSGDRARLAQILINLVTNAVKFTAQRGVITVTLLALGDQAEVRVKDNGAGISEALRPNIFGLFVQGEQDIARSGGGLGLGLALVKQLCQMQGGSVEAFSKGVEGEGSEFIVRLPLAGEPVDSQSLRADRARKLVLIVDDNVDSAISMGMLVESMGYGASIAHDGREALRLITGEAPDLVLLDLGLPGLSGLEVARHVRTNLVDPPPLVAVSGYGQDSDREATFKAGFYAHLAKPCDAGQLQNLLDKMLA